MEKKSCSQNYQSRFNNWKVIVAGKNIQKNEHVKPKEKVKVKIPKPKSLVGGGEVYQNDDVPYWYCRIKNGRDVFMHVYMEDLTEEDLLYDSKTGRKRKFYTDSQKKFKGNALEALKNKPKEGFRWIPVYEPSITPDGNIQFIEDEKPLVGRSCSEWDQMLKRYSPENESDISHETTYFLVLLRWLKDGIATLEELADYSEKIGHYRDSKDSKHELEKTGERKFGGLCGFAGNTCKIAKNSDWMSGYSRLGGSFNSRSGLHSLTFLGRVKLPSIRYDDSVGLLELKK